MSENLLDLYGRQYADNVELLLQEAGGKFAPYVDRGSYQGEQASPVDQIGSIDAQKVTGRFTAMPRVDAATDRRWVFPQDYDLPQLVDKFDKLRVLSDPQSKYVMNAAYAMGRAQDDELISSFFSASKTGKNGGTSTSFPAADVVAVTQGAAAATGLNVAKLREALKLLGANFVDLDREEVYMGISSKQHDDLLAEVQVVSTDFNDRPVLVDGKVTRFLGINFIRSERLDTDSNGYRRNPVWVPSGMHLGQWQEIGHAVSQREDLRGRPYQVYSCGTFGGTRLEEGRVIEIKSSEA